MENYSKEILDKIQEIYEKFGGTIPEYEKNHWSAICANFTLTEEFIEVFRDKVHWIVVFEAQDLSKEFILKYKNKVNWEVIARYQNLSEDFVFQYINYLKPEWLLENKKISGETKDRIQEYHSIKKFLG